MIMIHYYVWPAVCGKKSNPLKFFAIVFAMALNFDVNLKPIHIKEPIKATFHYI